VERREARGGTLILGGGFAGSYVARLLKKRGSTIVSPENVMLSTPLLPEAGAGTLEPRHVVVPIRQMCPHAETLAGPLEIGYERLAVALGAVTRTLPVPGLAEAGRPEPYGYRMLGQVATLGRYKGIAEFPGPRVRGFAGWFIARTYHLYQLSLVSRKLRVVLTVAFFFRRDVVELSMLGHPRRLGE
jgi:NADH dehydrogenase FAD-containing subunit